MKTGIINQTKGRVDTIFGAQIRTIFQRAPVPGPFLCKYVSGTCLASHVMNGKIHDSIYRVIKAGKHLQYQSPTITPAAPCSP